ncbi:MAG: plastocyanin/azurin family copper-binding protein [Nitrospirota bacterium]|nr:plastocyanin/azurin family copper-binding protein [Nitrospirota bacterium]
MKNRVLEKSILGLCLIVCLGFISLSSGFAVPGQRQIMLLDREPFYSPPSISLQAGQTVRWRNQAMQPHTITHDGCSREGKCAFHSGHLHPGEQFSVRDLTAGTYYYHCNIHPFMRGLIVVGRKPLQNFSTTEL